MKHLIHRVGIAALVVAALAVIAPTSAYADEDAERAHHKREAARTKKIVKALINGVEALQALEGHEELTNQLREVIAHLKRAGPQPKKKAGKNKRGNAERETAERYLEIYHLAHDVLRDAKRMEHAEVMEHAKHALETALEGRRDDESMRIRKTAPKRGRRAEALLLAAEILADKDDHRRAKLLAELGRKFQGQERKRGKREREGREREREEDDFEGGLERRVDIMRMAVVALEEAERKDLAKTLTRAIHTGELLLEGRQDEEARKVFERTPKLGQLAELIGFAGNKWKEFGNQEKAAACKLLSKYYAKRSRAQAKEADARKHAAAREHEAAAAAQRRDAERARDVAERSHRLERVRRELAEMHEILQRINRRLQELEKDGR